MIIHWLFAMYVNLNISGSFHTANFIPVQFDKQYQCNKQSGNFCNGKRKPECSESKGVCKKISAGEYDYELTNKRDDHAHLRHAERLEDTA